MTEQPHIPSAEPRRTATEDRHTSAVRPLHEGRMVIPDFDVNDVVPYLDWQKFFTRWGIASPESEEGTELRRAAQELLRYLNDSRLLKLQAVIGIYPVRSEGDELLLTDAKGRTARLSLKGMNRHGAPLCAADLIDTEGDWAGVYALTAGIGARELRAKFECEEDSRSARLVEILTPLLADAFAEVLHLFIRRQMWGCEQGEAPTEAQILAGEYRGLRADIGSRALPCRSSIGGIFRLLGVELTTEIRLTPEDEPSPEDTLCGVIFADGTPLSADR